MTSPMELLQPRIKYKDVTIPSITTGIDGYISIENKFPSGMNNFLFAIVWDYGNVSDHTCFDVNAAGNYIRGGQGSTIINLVIRFYYTD